MFRSLIRLGICALACVQPASPVLAQPLNLVGAVQAAMVADPLLKASGAQRDATHEQRAQAIAQVLPQFSLQASKSSNVTDAANIVNGGQVPLPTNRYDSDAKSAMIRQAVFRPRLFFNLLQGNVKSQQGDSQFEVARQRTVAKAARNYAEYVSRYENLQAARAEVGAAELRARQGEMLRNAGEISDIEVASAASALATARSRLKEAVSGLAVARRELEATTRMPVSEAPPPGDWRGAARAVGAIVKTPVPEVELGRHPEIAAQQLAVESALLEKRKAASDHAPTVDLVAGLSEGTSAQDIAIGRYTRTRAVGFQLTIPIFSGGATQSMVRENEALWEKAEYELQALQTKVENDRARTRDEVDYRSDAARAAEAELQAAQLALQAAEQAVKTGIGSEVELADRRARHMRATATLARSVMDVIVSYAEHLLSLGVLDLEDLRPLSAALAAQ